ncbi:MAG TPA: galactokinase [Balneolales bacterium]|nr:galactokinase [Balneolales bacterium]
MDSLYDKVRTTFESQYDNEPLLIRSPGRVNLIGEHTDYNEGFVLPAAIDKVIVFGLGKNNSTKGRIYSVDMKQSFEFDISAEPFVKSDLHWPNYILGAVEQLKKAGHKIGGFDCAFGGDIPIGAGLSSSAAVEGGLLFGLTQLFDLDVDKLTMVQMGVRTENDFVGVNCGIMDQFINIFGEDHQVIKLDCRSLDFELVPFERDDVRVVLCDTQVRRELASSEYNVRRKQCEDGVAILKKYDAGINSLRDVTIEMLKRHKDEFDPIIYKRCKYVVEENNRVLAACNDLSRNDFKAFGKRMFQSHDGLSNEYEVSCEELDVLVEEARKVEGVLGSRMMGAGFGGCTINIVEEEHLESFTAHIQKAYKDRTGKSIKVYKTSIDAGTEVVTEEEKTRKLV